MAVTDNKESNFQDLEQKVDRVLANQQTDHDLLLLILQRLPGQATGFTIEVETMKRENKNTMPKSAVKHGVSFELLVNGTVRYTAVLQDDAGRTNVTAPTGLPPLVWTVDQPAALSLAPDPSDTSGLNLIQLGTGISVATGVVVSASTTFPGASAPDVVTADPVDVNPDVATGFKISESAA